MLIMKTFGLILPFFVTSTGAADVRDKLRKREAARVKKCILSAQARQSTGANLESLGRAIGRYETRDEGEGITERKARRKAENLKSSRA